MCVLYNTCTIHSLHTYSVNSSHVLDASPHSYSCLVGGGGGHSHSSLGGHSRTLASGVGGGTRTLASWPPFHFLIHWPRTVQSLYYYSCMYFRVSIIYIYFSCMYRVSIKRIYSCIFVYDKNIFKIFSTFIKLGNCYQIFMTFYKFIKILSEILKKF